MVLTWAIQGPSCGESVWSARSGEIEIEIEIREVVKVEGVTCTLSVLPTSILTAAWMNQ